MKRPAFQFYPGDWLEDIGLRASSLAARGLWADMLCFMHQGEPYGHLRKNGRDISPADIARMVGTRSVIVSRLIRELETHHVFSRTEHGTIFSRRQVRDERIRNARAQGGSESAKNPNASRRGDRRGGGKEPHGGVAQGVPQGVAKGGGTCNPPSSPSSSSTTEQPSPTLPCQGGSEPSANSPKATRAEQAEQLLQVWLRLVSRANGHLQDQPPLDAREKIRAALREGRPFWQIAGSISEQVRDGLRAIGEFDESEQWPPEGWLDPHAEAAAVSSP